MAGLIQNHKSYQQTYDPVLILTGKVLLAAPARSIEQLCIDHRAETVFDEVLRRYKKVGPTDQSLQGHSLHRMMVGKM